jgi:DNA polymerase-3 subunit epsilon
MSLYGYQTLPSDWDAFYSEQIQQSIPESLLNFYRPPLLTATQSVKATDFVAIDLETTGMNALEDDIISIGIVPFDVHRIYLSQAQHWVVRSEQLTSDSVVVHGITHTDVETAPLLRSIIPKLIPHLMGKQVVMHYRYMEREFLRKAVTEQMDANWLFPVIDTLELEVKHLKQEQSLFDKLRNKALPSLRLPSVRERYNLPAYENHHALVDALATAELLQAQIAKQGLENKDVRSLWT